MLIGAAAATAAAAGGGSASLLGTRKSCSSYSSSLVTTLVSSRHLVEKVLRFIWSSSSSNRITPRMKQDGYCYTSSTTTRTTITIDEVGKKHSTETNTIQNPSGSSNSSSRRKSSNLSVVRVGKIIWLWILMPLMVVYYFLFYPPLNLIFPSLPSAGANSVYVPGNGFSGFWFHLSFLQERQKQQQNLSKYKYYCSSSGCLSTVLAGTNMTLDELYSYGSEIQNLWLQGNISRYDIVTEFVDNIITPETYDQLTSNGFITQIHFILSNMETGVSIHRGANTIQQLKQLLIQTTWIPFITGESILFENQYLDGAFSRALHPKCEYDIIVPLNYVTLIHSLNPALKKEHVIDLWETGKSFTHPINQ